MRVRGNYIMMEKIEEAEKISGLTLEYSDQDTDRMTIHKGIVLDFGDLVKGVEKGEICFYNKSRAFALKLKGETYWMVSEDHVILFDSPEPA